MTAKKNQANSCLITGTIIGKIKFRRGKSWNGDNASFKIRNHFSFYDSNIAENVYGDLTIEVFMIGSHVAGQIEHLGKGDNVSINGKFVAPAKIYGLMLIRD